MHVEISYVVYLLVSVALTVWVARVLHRNGRPFLVEAFKDNEPLADSVNRLLVVGFYLINIGYVTLALRYGIKPTSTREAIEFLSTKIGLVLLVLGAMHSINVLVFSRMRRRSRVGPELLPPAPPVEPEHRVTAFDTDAGVPPVG